jgi:RNA polymerase sigma-70 factor (ECF subfamily)
VADDARYIDQALAGNAEAFGMLVQKYQDRLYNTILHFVGGSEDAHDITQDAFVQAFTKLRSFHRTSAFYTWLYRIAFNLAMTRQRRRRPVASLDVAKEHAALEPVSRAEDPHEHVERSERAVQVQAALAALSEDHRSVLILREIDDFDYENIADVLGVPVGTVRSRLHRARIELKQQLLKLLAEKET